MLNSPDKLNNLVFEDREAKKAFETILEILGYITPSFISREDFNSKKGKFLEENGENEFGQKTYTLYLPEDLKISETPAIILRVNRITFGEDLPEYASTNELKFKIVKIVDILIKKLSNTIDKIEKYEIEKALKKYYLLYEQLFGSEEAKKLNDSIYRKEILTLSEKDKNTKYNSQYREYLLRVETLESLDDLKNEITGELSRHFREAFFENGINALRYGLMTLTELNLENIKEKEKEKRKGDNMNTNNIIEDNLDSEEQKLRNKIGIDGFKEKLLDARNSGNEEEVIRLEKEVTNKILKVLNTEYPYQDTLEDYGFQPSKILKFKELYCLGFSLVGHSFLSELGIKHNGLDIPWHSALEVIIGDESYYFDPTWLSRIELLNRGNRISYNGMEGIYYAFEVRGYEYITTSGNPEMILLSQIYNNKGTTLLEKGDHELAVKMYDRAIELNPKSLVIYNTKGFILYFTGRKNEGTLYEFMHDLLNNNTINSLEILKEEKLKIIKLFKERNFEGIRLYLLSLEGKLD